MSLRSACAKAQNVGGSVPGRPGGTRCPGPGRVLPLRRQVMWPGQVGGSFCSQSSGSSFCFPCLFLREAWFIVGAQQTFIPGERGDVGDLLQSVACFPATQGLAWLGVGWDGSGRDSVMWREEYQQWWLTVPLLAVCPGASFSTSLCFSSVSQLVKWDNNSLSLIRFST